MDGMEGEVCEIFSSDFLVYFYSIFLFVNCKNMWKHYCLLQCYIYEEIERNQKLDIEEIARYKNISASRNILQIN